MDRRDVLRLSGALAATALAGCLDGDEAPAASGEDGPETGLPTGEPDATDGQLAQLSTSLAGFGLDLHERLVEAEGGNLFLSPYSVSAALAMAYAGAEGDTREQMTEALHYELGEDVHPAFGDLEAALEDRETTSDPVDGETVDAFQLGTANAVWGREDYSFADEYVATLEGDYGAGLRRAAFASDPEGERERINDWVAEQTADRIDDLLPASAISAQTVSVIVNAIYFAASWLHEFDPADTTDETFTAIDGSEATVEFMHQNVRANYGELDGLEALELPYVGRDVSMVLLLPEAGSFEGVERSLDAETLFGIFDELGDATGDVALPRFEFESSVELAEPLADLGMPDAFDAGADFSGMVDGDGSGPWIDGVYHDTYVAVDEEGTEASAATAVVTNESAPPDWGELRFDRPFLFCIRDRPTDAVLFLGRVVDAGEARYEE